MKSLEGMMVVVNDKMQKGYKYVLTEKVGQNFSSAFNPELTPKEMLELGVFGGKYMTDCKDEFPKSWFKKAKQSRRAHNMSLNFFKVDASQSLKVWRDNGWINEEHDPRGWFQWYCRYYMGRRLIDEDRRQIKRWRLIKRHIGQIKSNCIVGDLWCRPRQRQALLHWAYDSRKI